ncbi:hypothetical protein PILCRDRAFT_56284, partial [Piloderma croceum F 1598]
DSSHSTTAHDINHFFSRGNKKVGSQTVCKVCEKDPTAKHNFRYSAQTANATLRSHLEKYHADEYLQFYSEGKWPNLLPKKRYEGTTESSIGAQNTQDGRPRPAFTWRAFLTHIINFIVADDQSINVIECREFRDLLLLLRADIQDKDIPHRTKIREAIIKAWESWFQNLKEELTVRHWTLDNASNNGTFMQELGILLNSRDISFDAKDRRIMCFPHIVNICYQHIIKEFTNIELADIEEIRLTTLPNLTNTPSYEDAVKRDPVARGRNVVRILRSSGQRRDAFDDIIKDGNTKGWFRVGDPPRVIRLRPLQLLRDAVDHFLALPINNELAMHKITEMEWRVLQDFQIILEIPHYVQQFMSGESTPILSNSIPAFELFLSKWEDLAVMHPRLKPWINISLAYSIDYYQRMDRTSSYIVAMVLNPAIRMSWIRKHWDPEYIDDAERKVKQILGEYRERVRAKAAAPGVSTSTSAGHNLVQSHQTSALDSLMQHYGLVDEMDIANRENHDEQTLEQEYQSYITAPLSPRGTNTLKFWESSESIHPTFFEMALDYLPIQASAVPSERAFSSSAETDTKKRNRINPVLMEALQMLKYALKKARLDFTSGWIVSEKDMQVEKSEEDLLALLLGGNHEDSMDRIIQNLGEDDSD